MKDVDVSYNVYLMVSIGSLLISSYSFPESTILLALFIGKEGISIVKIKSILIESYWWFQIKDKERKGKERKRRKKVTVNTEKGKSTIVAVEKKTATAILIAHAYMCFPERISDWHQWRREDSGSFSLLVFFFFYFVPIPI